ncbi:MAG: DUF6273 domain-containing protein [Oscillospiraceae bacterium]|jgi:hypothetical protein|nr:DUF6273 domain-containing protein [Oscillospiraceae bacterium]
MTLGDEVVFGKYKWNVLDIKEDKMLLLCSRPVKFTNFMNKRIKSTWKQSAIREYLNEKFLNHFTQEDLQRIVENDTTNPKNTVFDYNADVKFANTTDKFFILSLEEVTRYFTEFENFRTLYEAAEDDGGIFGFTDMVRPGRRMRVKLQINKIADVHTSSIIYGFMKQHTTPEKPFNLLKLTKGKRTFDWWLRTSGFNSLHMSVVRANGYLDFRGVFVGFQTATIRPAVWVKIQ